jgi:FkbM family methyltransferase
MPDITKHEIKDLIGTGGIILDIGSYNAKDAVELAEICETSVHCFEPNPASYEIMKFLNNDSLILWNYAVCAHNGTTVLNLSNHPQSDTIKRPKKHLKLFPKVKYKDTVTVKATTLDSWYVSVLKDQIIDFIWADVNGAEDALLLGGSHALSRTRFLYIEYCETELYERALNKQRILKALPGFDEIGDYNFAGNFGNILLRNKILHNGTSDSTR